MSSSAIKSASYWPELPGGKKLDFSGVSRGSISAIFDGSAEFSQRAPAPPRGGGEASEDNPKRFNQWLLAVCRILGFACIDFGATPAADIEKEEILH